MKSIKRQARIAGLFYLLASIPAAFAWVYVANKLIVTGDTAATANNLRASETLFRLSIGSELIGSIVFIFVVLALYRLFKAVDKEYSLVMALLLLISLPISLLSVVNEIAALTAVTAPRFLSAFDQHQLDGLAYLFIRLHGQMLVVAQIFWGLWLFPFGILIIRSGFIPRFLGYLLFIAAVGYIANSFAALIIPAQRQSVARFADILQIAETPIIFWLLIWGAKDQPARHAISAPAVA